MGRFLAALLHPFGQIWKHIRRRRPSPDNHSPPPPAGGDQRSPPPFVTVLFEEDDFNQRCEQTHGYIDTDTLPGPTKRKINHDETPPGFEEIDIRLYEDLGFPPSNYRDPRLQHSAENPEKVYNIGVAISENGHGMITLSTSPDTDPPRPKFRSCVPADGKNHSLQVHSGSRHSIRSCCNESTW